MKNVAGCLMLLSVTLLISPAAAQTLYSNGPTNGNTDAWTVNFGFVVSDSFYLGESGITVTGATFAMWLFPGDTLTSAELSITSRENGGTSYFDQTVDFTQTGCVANHYGYNVCNENTYFSGPTLSGGTYWLNLQNASVPSGDPVYWDENSGGAHAEPPGASQNSVGTIPAESFTLLAACGAGKSSADCASLSPSQSGAQSTVPEPGSMLLFGSGYLALFGFWGALRRKLF
ncbi:MAG: PEP-CTERM sorting domain-containing protein [Candidatus Korobacteraceae bacterium]